MGSYVAAVNLFLWPVFQVALVVKNPPANARDTGLIPASGRSPGVGNDSPLQYSCLGNPMEKGAWWATVHSAAKNQTWLRRLSTHMQGNIKGCASEK